jgi:hypothetical protein
MIVVLEIHDTFEMENSRLSIKTSMINLLQQCPVIRNYETPWGYPGDTLGIPWRHLGDTLETPWGYPGDTLGIS